MKIAQENTLLLDNDQKLTIIKADYVKKLLADSKHFKRNITDGSRFSSALDCAQPHQYHPLFKRLYHYPKLFLKVIKYDFIYFLENFPDERNPFFDCLLQNKTLLPAAIPCSLSFIESLEICPHYTEKLWDALLSNSKFFMKILSRYNDIQALYDAFPLYQKKLFEQILNKYREFNPIFPECVCMRLLIKDFPTLKKLFLTKTLHRSNLYLKFFRGIDDPEDCLTLIKFREDMMKRLIKPYPHVRQKIWRAEINYIFPLLLRGVLKNHHQISEVDNFIKALANNGMINTSTVNFMLPLLTQTIEQFNHPKPHKLEQYKGSLIKIKVFILNNYQPSLVELCINKLKPIWSTVKDMVPADLNEKAIKTFTL